MKRKALYAGKAELVPKRRRAPSRKGPPPPFLLALLLLFLGLLFMVWVRLEVLGLGYEISHLKAQKDELLLRIPVPEYEVLILLPEGEARPTITVDATRLRKFSSIANSLVELLPKKIWEVMTLNGLLYSEVLGYDPKPALKAVEIGAIGAGLSGTGPAIAAVCEECDEIAEEWSSLGRVFRKKITNQMAEIRRS